MAGIETLNILIGTWKGSGVAKFPTIETTRYIQEISFEGIGDDPALQYISRTWYLINGNQGVPLQWEMGFINALGENEYSLSNVQNNGRVEVLSGSMQILDAKYHLSFMSKFFGNDPRMVKSGRDYIISGDELKFSMDMATLKTPLFQRHLDAVLKKV